MRFGIALILPLLLMGCAGEPLPVDSHELMVTEYTDFDGIDDRICMLSTYSGTKGWHHWYCHDDRAPVEITGLDVVLRTLEGNDTVVERFTTGNAGCSCTCNTGSAYGTQYDYRADGVTNASVQVWDWPPGWEDATCVDSGTDKVLGGRARTSFIAGDGDDEFLGGPYEDLMDTGWDSLGCEGANLVYDIAGGTAGNWFTTRGGPDKIRDNGCDLDGLVDCGPHGQDHYQPCGGGIVHYCEVADWTIAKPICPTDFP